MYVEDAFLQELGSKIVPRIGIMDIGFDIAALLNHVRLSSGLREQLTAPTDHLLNIIQESDNNHDLPLTSTPHGNIEMILLSNLVLSMIDEGGEQQYSDKYYRNFLAKMKHGVAVAHLLTGESPFGVSRSGEIDSLWMIINGLEQAVLPDIINLSAFFNFSGKIFTPPELLAPAIELARQTILVTSAGNDFPDPIESAKRMLQGEIVIVGSSEPSGCASWFSAAGDSVTICAPSSEHLQTFGSDGRISFGGTSGAVPLVTGALADVLSILPDLNVSEAIHLLQKTAVKGAVLSLNYYKLMRVAAKLAKLGWPEQREKIFSAELYDFTAEAQQLLEALGSTTEEVFGNLRKAFFLDPTNHTVRARLAELYAQAGYTAQASFYSNAPTPARDTTEYDFLTAIAAADIESLTVMLPILRTEQFWQETPFTHIIEDMDETDRHKVIEFLKAQSIVDIEVTDTGDIRWEKL